MKIQIFAAALLAASAFTFTACGGESVEDLAGQKVDLTLKCNAEGGAACSELRGLIPKVEKLSPEERKLFNDLVDEQLTAVDE